MEHQDKQQQEYKDLMKSIEMPFDLEGQWEDIVERLPEKSKKRKGIVFWLFGILILAIIGMVLLNQNDGVIANQESQSINELETYSSRKNESDKNTTIQSAESTVETKDISEIEIASIENINTTNNSNNDSSKLIDERNVSNQDAKANQQSNRNIDYFNSSSIGKEESNISSEKGNTYLNPNIKNPVTKSKLTTQINPLKIPSVLSNDTENSRLVKNSATLNSRPFNALLSPENLIQTPYLVELNSSRINKWTVGLSQQVSTLEMLFDGIAGEPINSLNNEIKSTYRTKTSLFAMRNMNNRFSIYGGLTFRSDQERIEAERITDIQEREVLSNDGSLYIDNFNQTTFYEGMLTETTTTTRKVGHNNSYKAIGLQLGIRYQVFGGFYLNGNVSQYMVFASKGKTISIDNEIIDLKNTPRNGGIELEIGAGYAFSLTRRLKFDTELNMGNTFNQQSHIKNIKQNGISIGGSIGIRYLINSK